MSSPNFTEAWIRPTKENQMKSPTQEAGPKMCTANKETSNRKMLNAFSKI